MQDDLIAPQLAEDIAISRRELVEVNFYPEYGRRFEDMVIKTIRRLPDNAELGHEAFPAINRPELRKILCEHYDY